MLCFKAQVMRKCIARVRCPPLPLYTFIYLYRLYLYPHSFTTADIRTTKHIFFFLNRSSWPTRLVERVYLAAGDELQDMSEFIRNNAGKAFEFMLEVCEEDRKAAGLPDIATVRADAGENPEVSESRPHVVTAIL